MVMDTMMTTQHIPRGLLKLHGLELLRYKEIHLTEILITIHQKITGMKIGIIIKLMIIGWVIITQKEIIGVYIINLNVIKNMIILIGIIIPVGDINLNNYQDYQQIL